MAILATAILGSGFVGAVVGAIFGLATYDGFFGSRADTAGILALGLAVIGAGVGFILGVLLLVIRRWK
jgi:hypothetical protein